MTNVLAGVPSINPPIIQVPRTMSRGGLSLGQPALCIRLQRVLRTIGSIQAKPTVSYRNCSQCVCVSLCIIVVHNTAQNSSDNLPCYPPGNHQCSGVIYWRGGEWHNFLYYLLHFAWVVDDAKCIVVTRVCVSVCVSVCLSVCPRPYAHTTARTRM